MPLPSRYTSRVHALSQQYRDLIFVVLLTALLACNTASANTIPLHKSYTEKLGINQQQADANFAQAKLAFDDQEYVLSFRAMKMLAESGHREAQYFLATQYDTGLGVKKDEYSAYRWYKKAAMAGLRSAQHNLAVAYAQGYGVKADLNKAINWWERAATQGHTDSQFNLGIIYATGKGVVVRDMKKALKWWHMAAINGDAAAQFNLGAIYANGLGVPGSTCEAILWLQRSEKNGFKQAHTALSQIQHSADYNKCK